MLDDDASINRINPFVNSGPGTVRRVEKFSAFKEPTEEDAQFEIYEDGPLYSHGIPFGGPTEDSMCPVSTTLYPQRNIDTGFTDYRKNKILVEKVRGKKRMFPLWMLIVAVLIILFLLISRR
tara:strand:+ start:1193 stop:1558 length:366 start_codon:yes stop_codon:yes gene_type:complete